MNRPKTLRLLGVMTALALAANARANGFRLPDQDAFATARGEAFVATADNPSAIYYNPAGITQLEGNNVRGGLYGIYLDTRFSPPKGTPNYGTNYYNRDRFAAAPQIFYTWTPTNSAVSFGLGVYSPFGGRMSWPQDTGFRAVALDASLTYITVNPVVALKLAPNLSVGAGVTANYANLEMSQGLSKFYPPGSIHTNYFRFTGDGWSVGYNLGVLWQPHEKVSLGATFRSAAHVRFKGQTEFEDYGVAGLYPPSSRPAHTDFEFPISATVGVSYRPTPKWNLEFDADYTDWSSFESNSIYQANPPNGLFSQNPLQLQWQPSWMYEFGLTRFFDSGWHASAGVVYNESSVPDAYYTPLAADLDRYFFSAGAGYRGKRFNFDVAYQFGYGPTRTVTGSLPSSAPGGPAGQNGDGNYHFISQAVLVSLGLHF